MDEEADEKYGCSVGMEVANDSSVVNVSADMGDGREGSCCV